MTVYSAMLLQRPPDAVCLRSSVRQTTPVNSMQPISKQTLRGLQTLRSLLLAACVLPGLAFAADKPAKQPDKPADPPGVVRMSTEQQRTVQLLTVKADSRPITEPVRVPGVVMFDPGHVAVLRPFNQARVLRLLVGVGDRVMTGQPLAELDMPSLATYQQDLVTARAMVPEAEAALALARAALARGEILARDGSLARAEVERRRLMVVQASTALDAARARATALGAIVGRLSPSGAVGVSQLVSPIAGVVAVLSATPGEVLDAGRELFTVADLSVVMVLAQVPEASAALVSVGDAARITAGATSRIWEGKVATLGAALDPQARTLPARITLPNGDNVLRSGMFVDVTMTSSLGRDAVVVPASAVQMIADKATVFLPDGEPDRFRAQEIQQGVTRQDWVEVRRGLRAGDAVVTQGSFELKAVLQKSLLGG